MFKRSQYIIVFFILSFISLYSFKIISFEKEFNLKGKVYIYNNKDVCKGATVFVYSRGKELSGNTDKNGEFSITYHSNNYQNTASDTLKFVVLHSSKQACGFTDKKYIISPFKEEGNLDVGEFHLCARLAKG